MQDEEWIKTLEDGRMAEIHLPRDCWEMGHSSSAQLAGNEVVYSVVLMKRKKNPLSRDEA